MNGQLGAPSTEPTPGPTDAVAAVVPDTTVAVVAVVPDTTVAPAVAPDPVPPVAAPPVTPGVADTVTAPTATPTEARESLMESFNLEEIFADIMSALTPIIDQIMELFDGLFDGNDDDSGGAAVAAVLPAVVAELAVTEAESATSNALSNLYNLPGGLNNYFGNILTVEAAATVEAGVTADALPGTQEQVLGATASLEIADLARRGVTNLVSVGNSSLNSDSNYLSEFLDSDACDSIEPKPTVNTVNIATAANEAEAESFWNDSSNKTQIREVFALYRTGNLAIIPRSNNEQSAAIACVLHSLSNPTLTLEQVTQLIAPEFASSAEFARYHEIIKYVISNAELRVELGAEAHIDVAQAFADVVATIGSNFTNENLGIIRQFLRQHPGFVMPDINVNLIAREKIDFPAGVFIKLNTGARIEAPNIPQALGLRRLSDNLREGPSMSTPEVPDGTLQPHLGQPTYVVIPRTMYLVSTESVRIPRNSSISGPISIGLVS